MANKKQKPPSKDYTVDAGYVIRCKECKSYLKIGYKSYICGKTFGLTCARPDDFCSHGERKQDGK